MSRGRSGAEKGPSRYRDTSPGPYTYTGFVQAVSATEHRNAYMLFPEHSLYSLCLILTMIYLFLDAYLYPSSSLSHKDID